MEQVPEWMAGGEEWNPEWAAGSKEASQEASGPPTPPELGEWAELWAAADEQANSAMTTPTDANKPGTAQWGSSSWAAPVPSEDKRVSSVTNSGRKSFLDGAFVDDDGEDDWAQLMDGIIKPQAPQGESQ